MLHTILRENDSMGHTLTVNGNEEPGKQTQKHLKRIVQVGTQRTLQAAAVFLVVLIPASPVHPLAQLLPEKLKGGVDHP